MGIFYAGAIRFQAVKDKNVGIKTIHDRKRFFKLFEGNLKELGFKNLRVENIKQKHIDTVLTKWNDDGLSVGTIKNRMSHIRKLLGWVGKNGMLPKDNLKLRVPIPNREHNHNISKAVYLKDYDLTQVKDPYIVHSLKLQYALGLRREESLKIQLHLSDKGDHIHIYKSKGCVPRQIPILSSEQRRIIDAAKAFADGGSLIPNNKKYITQEKLYDYYAKKLGLRGHGLRHAYAQERYLKLTGEPCRAVKALSNGLVTKEFKKLDRASRDIISKEMGHSRRSITSTYIGEAY